MNEIRHYRDLKVWQKSMELTKAVFRVTSAFPADQRYVLIAQMQRCALSVPSNIAEGRARHSEKDFIYHLNVAKGSLAELETQIILAHGLGYMKREDELALLGMTEEITKMLHGLKSSLQSPRDATIGELTLAKT